MDTHTIQEKLIEAIRGLTEEQAAALLPVVRLICSVSPAREYDETADVAIGLIEGPTDIASRVEDILEEDANARGGWTQKDNS